MIAAPASGSFDVSLGEHSIRSAAPLTASYLDFKPVTLGVVDIASAGMTTLAVRPVADGWQPMNLKSIVLTPVTADAGATVSPARQRVRVAKSFYCYYGPGRAMS
jgi:hypothetical protein